MTGQPEEQRRAEELSDDGVGLGMSEEDNTFEPEEAGGLVPDEERPVDPEVVDDQVLPDEERPVELDEGPRNPL
ncbi:hypothetical protein [Ornithinimicrobium tianjinense]|uniref:Uncharacterized protein n=1 Tax=Ornithinimicrobium tianjinense TaxID=1195761 RepID=A0A917F2Z8_9MICO|nr:hypothetical protein [Ornithinimicrobium tianjinense]GGF47713.1 hypothetical protein GCM10011366_14420 [Ornithinimicrobium tianjinense]